MAKVSFNKLKCKLNEDIKIIEFAGEDIEVKQYLPISEKLQLIGRVIELAHDENYNYSNPVKTKVFTDLEIVYAFTNINFTEKQKEAPAKLYDLLTSTQLLANILSAIPQEDLNIIYTGVEQSVTSVYQYQNSIVGVMDNLKQSYGETEMDIQSMRDAVQSLTDSPILQKFMPLLNE